MEILEARSSAPPQAVRTASLLWATAVGAGVVETIGTIAVLAADGSQAGPLVAGAMVRAVIYTVVLLVVRQLWLGRRWARWVLAVGLGVFGTLSLIAEPLAALLSGSGVPPIDLTLVLVVLVRSVHVGAVWAACVLMFRPAANRYFQSGSQARRARRTITG